MRKIHLPTSIKQTKFVSRIQAYRSSVYLQGFRGFTFSSTQSRQTKAESYVKYWNVKPKAPAAIKQFQVRRIFPPNRRKIDYFPFECFFFPLAYTIYACAVRFWVSLNFIWSTFLLWYAEKFCFAFAFFMLFVPTRDLSGWKSIQMYLFQFSSHIPRMFIAQNLNISLSARRLRRVWIGFILVHETIFPLLVLVFCYLEHTRSPYEIYYSWFCASELRLIHTMRRRRREVAWKFEFVLHFTSRIRHKIDFRLRARLILSFVIMTVVKRRRRISIMSSQTRSLQICVKGGEADGMEKSISVLRTLSIFHGQSLS